MRRSTVLSLGSINVDLQVRAEQWPTASETTLASDYLQAGGGKAANVALLASRLGVPARLFGRIGEDVLADLALGELRDAEVDLRGVSRAAGAATAISMIVVRPDGDKTIVLAPNANMSWTESAEDALARAIGAAEKDAILVADLEIPERIVRACLRAARERGLTTVLDPSPADRVDDELLSLSDYLTPNPRECERLTDVRVTSEEDARRAGRALLGRGVSHACMKLQHGGALLVGEREQELFRAPKVEVVDKTGAGDAFAGGLAAALACGRSAHEAVQQAVAASTFAVTRYGSQAAYPTRDELARFMAEKRA